MEKEKKEIKYKPQKKEVKAILSDLLFQKFEDYRKENGYKRRPELLRYIVRDFFIKEK